MLCIHGQLMFFLELNRPMPEILSEVGVGKDPRLVKRFVYAVRGEEDEDER
jgi:hypothetical protein